MDVVVLVEGEPAPELARLMDLLQARGHALRTVRTAGEAELAQRSGSVDALVAAGDVSQLRRRVADVPIVGWLPVRSTEQAAGLLELGVDEVLDASMGEREQLARLGAVARRAPVPSAAVVLGPLRVDRSRGEASWQGRRLQLTPREREVLQVLAEAQGATVRREVLYRAVWGYAMARGDRTVDVNVKRLRAKLAGAVGAPLTIETEPAVGYRLSVSETAVTAL